MVLTYCPEPKEGQGTPFEPFGTFLYSEKVSAQKVLNREISGRLLLKKINKFNNFTKIPRVSIKIHQSADSICI